MVKLGIWIAALSLLACTNAAQPVAPRTKPSNLIPDAEFTQLLLEMHRIEGARGGETLMGDSIPVWEIYAGTFARLGYTAEQVSSSYTYYHGDPAGMVRRYEIIMDSLRAQSRQTLRPVEP
jgi:hypothetical protein